MARFLLSRAAQAVVSILGVSTIVFVVMHLSGDPTLLLVPEGASRADVALLRHQLGFHRPLAVGALSMAAFARTTRASVVEGLGKDYVRAIRAKGVAMTPIVLRHVLRNASIPVITVAALEIANLLAGAVIVETVFAWPGLGQLAIQSIAGHDFLIVQALVLIASFTYITLNLLAACLYSVVDPRITLLAGTR